MTTSKHSTGQVTQELFSSQVASHASQLVVPGSREARQMTAGSGERLSALYQKPGPIGCFLKTLLESTMWGSTEYALKWKAEAWYERRFVTTTTKYRHFKKLCLSETSRKTLKRWDTTSPHHLRFRLVPLTRRRSDSDIGLWGTVTTDLNRNRTKPYKQGGQPLNMQVNKATWPAPTASMDQAGNVQRSKNRRDELLIGGLVRIWATPRSADGNKGVRTPTGYAKERQRRRDGCDLPTELCHHGQTTSGCLAQTESFVVRLMTLSAWLMGYTGAYLAHWETASSRKSRRRS